MTRDDWIFAVELVLALIYFAVLFWWIRIRNKPDQHNPWAPPGE